MSPIIAPSRSALLEISLPRLAENYRDLAQLSAGAACGACVKADAYGLGLDAVVTTLTAAGCKEFFVATPGEGLRVRGSLPDGAIYVLNGYQPGTAPCYAQAGLIPVLGDLPEIADWQRETRGAPAALQLDTGMARLGLDLGSIAELRSRHPDFRPILVLGHLACADTPADPRNHTQRERFDAALGALGSPRASLAGSCAMHLGNAFHYQLVRPGAALYGINPLPGQSNPMRAVVRLQAPVLQVRHLEAPTDVGYGGTYHAPAGQVLGTVALGYADGYPRAAGNRAQARIGAFTVPVVGRVSMDLMTVDLSAIPRAGLPMRAAAATFLDDDYGVDALAEAAGTIGYEILTRLGSSCARRYLPHAG